MLTKAIVGSSDPNLDQFISENANDIAILGGKTVNINYITSTWRSRYEHAVPGLQEGDTRLSIRESTLGKDPLAKVIL